MTSFMGPMAPPPPAQPQPQAMDFQTDPNNRQRFRQFLNNRMQPPMMQQPAMMQAPAHMPPILPEVDIFEPQGYADGGIVGFSNGGSTQPIEQRVMKNGQIGLFRGQTFLGFKQEPEKKPVDIGFGGDRKILERIRNFIGLEGGGEVPSTLPRSKRDAVAQKVAEMMAINAERVRAAQQNAEYNRLLREQDAINRKVALDRLRADQAESRQNMTLDSILSDIDYEARGLLRKADGGAVPPRRADIRGQDHMLSYITPDEADILKALGGSGEPGPMGIPAYDDIDESYGIDSYSDGGMNEGQDSVTADTYSGGGSSDTFSDDSGPDGFAELADTTGAIEGVDFDYSDADEVGDAIAEQTVINEILGGGGGGGTLGDTDVYSSVLNSPMRQDERTMNPADFESKYGFPPSGSSGTTKSQVVMGGGTDDMGSGVPLGGSYIDSTITKSEQKTSDLLGLDDELINVDDEAGAMGVRGPGSGYTEAGLPTGLNFVDTPQGRMTTNLAGTTAAQRADMPGYMNTRNEDGSLRGGIAGLVDPVLGNPVSSVYGYEIPDLATGQITGFTGPSNLPGLLGQAVSGVQDFIMGPPKTTEDLLQRGVYTGFGPGSQIGMEEGGEDQPVKPKVDPCPPGFSLVNGTCTPVSNSGDGSLDTGEIGTGQPPPPPASVIVPSSRQSMPFVGTMPSGYGTPMTGGVNPQVMSEMQKYAQLLSRPQPQYPVGLANGGSVSSNLDMAADNFLKALMPAA